MGIVVIELPAKWDELMEEKGYQPLSTFYLEANGTTPASAGKILQDNAPVNTNYYDMVGRRTKSNRRGAYINNGRKYVRQ